MGYGAESQLVFSTRCCLHLRKKQLEKTPPFPQQERCHPSLPSCSVRPAKPRAKRRSRHREPGRSSEARRFLSVLRRCWLLPGHVAAGTRSSLFFTAHAGNGTKNLFRGATNKRAAASLPQDTETEGFQGSAVSHFPSPNSLSSYWAQTCSQSSWAETPACPTFGPDRNTWHCFPTTPHVRSGTPTSSSAGISPKPLLPRSLKESPECRWHPPQRLVLVPPTQLPW